MTNDEARRRNDNGVAIRRELRLAKADPAGMARLAGELKAQTIRDKDLAITLPIRFGARVVVRSRRPGEQI